MYATYCEHVESPSNPVLLYRLAYSLWPQFNFPPHTSCRPFHEIWTLVAFLTVPQNNWFLINCLGWHWEQFTLFTNVWNLLSVTKYSLGSHEKTGTSLSVGECSSVCYPPQPVASCFDFLLCHVVWWTAQLIYEPLLAFQINKHRCVCYPICLFFLFTESNVDKLHFI